MVDLGEGSEGQDLLFWVKKKKKLQKEEKLAGQAKHHPSPLAQGLDPATLI